MSPWTDTTTVAISNNMVIIILILIAISISFPFGLNIHIAHFITRYLAHHELTQDKRTIFRLHTFHYFLLQPPYTRCLYYVVHICLISCLSGQIHRKNYLSSLFPFVTLIFILLLQTRNPPAIANTKPGLALIILE